MCRSRALHLEIQVDLRAQAQRHRIHRGQSGGIPVGAVAHARDRGLGGADQAHDLGVLQLRMAAHQPQDRAGALMAARHRGVARALLLLGFRQADLGFAELEAVIRVLLALLDFLAAELAGRDRVHALDALGGVAVGDGADFQRVHLAEIGDLIERQGGIIDEPHGGCFRHQRGVAHGKSPLCFAQLFLGAKPVVISDDGNWGLYSPPGGKIAMVSHPAGGLCREPALTRRRERPNS